VSDEDPKLLDEIFDEMVLATRGEPVCQSIERVHQPIVASIHILCGCISTIAMSYTRRRSPSFVPISGNMVATDSNPGPPFALRRKRRIRRTIRKSTRTPSPRTNVF
jgi:hypothetical protein